MHVPVHIINNLRETSWSGILTMFPFAPTLVEGYAQMGDQGLNTLFLESMIGMGKLICPIWFCSAPIPR